MLDQPQVDYYSVTNTMNGYKYRVKLDKIGNSCGLLSNDTTLIVYTLPTVNNVTIIQCDDDLDAVTTFNLTVKNDEISVILQMKPFLTTPHICYNGKRSNY
jgi:hypothetical protein